MLLNLLEKAGYFCLVLLLLSMAYLLVVCQIALFLLTASMLGGVVAAPELFAIL